VVEKREGMDKRRKTGKVNDKRKKGKSKKEQKMRK